MRSRLRGAAIVKLRHLMKTSILWLNELHPLQQTAAQAGGGGGLYFPSMCPVCAEDYTQSDEWGDEHEYVFPSLAVSPAVGSVRMRRTLCCLLGPQTWGVRVGK